MGEAAGWLGRLPLPALLKAEVWARMTPALLLMRLLVKRGRRSLSGDQPQGALDSAGVGLTPGGRAATLEGV